MARCASRAPPTPANLDPAAQGTWVDPQLAHLTCAGLMGYPDGPSPGGSRLIPEVAQAAPTVSRDGRSYTFIVRRGYRFSPPSGAPVTAHTFKYTIERSLSPRLDAPNTPDMRDVVGMSAYAAGRAAHVSGVIARGDELTIVLRRPSGSSPPGSARMRSARCRSGHRSTHGAGTPSPTRAPTTSPCCRRSESAIYQRGARALVGQAALSAVRLGRRSHECLAGCISRP
jgi:hypothetical protein